MSAFDVLCAVLLALAPGSAAAEDAPIAVYVRQAADVIPVAPAVARVELTGIELMLAELPPSPPDERDLDAHEAAIRDARALYTNAEFDACIAELADETAIETALASGRRDLAARLLLWRTACAVGAGQTGDAQREATRLATFGLDLPAEVGYAAPEVDAVLGDALRALDQAPRTPMRVVSRPVNAEVALDGRDAACRTPCVLSLPPGEHHIAIRALGRTPLHRVIQVAPDARSPLRLEVALAEASPERAASQWRDTYAEAPSIDDEASLRLIARAVRARRVAVIDATREGRRIRVRGALSIDGTPVARTERTVAERAIVTAVREVLRDLVTEARIAIPAPSLVEQPLFWVGVGVAVAASVAATLLLTQDPTVHTEVRIQ